MEVLNWSWTRLVLDGAPGEALLALFALIFLGIPLAVGIIGAAFMTITRRRKRDAFLFASLLALLTVISVVVATS